MSRIKGSTRTVRIRFVGAIGVVARQLAQRSGETAGYRTRAWLIGSVKGEGVGGGGKGGGGG